MAGSGWWRFPADDLAARLQLGSAEDSADLEIAPRAAEAKTTTDVSEAKDGSGVGSVNHHAP